MSTTFPPSYGYDKEKYTALEAITEAQRIAHGPMLFQAAVALRDNEILAILDQAGSKGMDFQAIAERTPLTDYALSLLLDVGLSMRVLLCNEGHYQLAKVGYYLLHDTMTRINMDFSKDVCYSGMQHLQDALEQQKPAGLKELIEADSIYPVLSKLPEKAQRSWFAYDHYYSDAAFAECLPLVFALQPKHIYDLGGNTGKWSRACVAYHPDVEVTILDLPEQIQLAKQQLSDCPDHQRIHGQGINILADTPLPDAADVWWMSQFLDCFSAQQVSEILQKVCQALPDHGYVCILEPLWNCQPFEAGALSLNAGSLYFTAMANGTSRFYSAEAMQGCIEQAGLIISSRHDNLGIGHSLLICQKA